MSDLSATDDHQPGVAKDNEEACPVEIPMLVSSKHMMLASRVFKAMLSATFSEGLTLRSTGKLELPLPGDDPVAFKILLNIIHGHPRSVPRQVDLELLSRLAVMVDKYKLEEVVEMFSDAWIKTLQDTLPKSLTADSPSWLFIFWVFHKPSEFKRVTKILQLESIGRLGEDEQARLPIPSSIIDAIETSRQEAIRQAISAIHRTIAKYQGSESHCPQMGETSFKCDAMTLGALIKGSKKLGIWPAPDSPYNGIGFSHLADSIRKINLPNYCNERARRHSYDFDIDIGRDGKTVCARVTGNIEGSIRSIKDGLCGLDLESFRRARSSKMAY